jgi:hypothetical protein
MGLFRWLFGKRTTPATAPAPLAEDSHPSWSEPVPKALAADIAAGFQLTGHTRHSWPEPGPRGFLCPTCHAEAATDATVCCQCGCALRCEKPEDLATQGVAYLFFMHLRDTTQPSVVDFLGRTYTHQQGPPWAYAVNGAAAIYLDCYPIELMQFDDSAWENLIDTLKALPAVTVIVHVLKRHMNDPQAPLDVVKAVLGEFRGVAQNQFGCCWSLPQLLSSQEGGKSSTPASRQDAPVAPGGQQEQAGWGYVEVGDHKPAAEPRKTSG